MYVSVVDMVKVLQRSCAVITELDNSNNMISAVGVIQFFVGALMSLGENIKTVDRTRILRLVVI